MCVLTISRETGSQGHFIAEQVAMKLGYRFIDKNAIGRVFSMYGADEFGIQVGYVPELWDQFTVQVSERRQHMINMLNQVVLAIAHLNNVVILGRSSFGILTGFADVLNVRIQAPVPVRIKRIMQQRKVADIARAEAIVEDSDALRSAFLKQFYGKTWDSCKDFDLVINTDQVPVSLAINWLEEAIHNLHTRPNQDSPTVASIQVDPILSSILADEFGLVTGNKE